MLSACNREYGIGMHIAKFIPEKLLYNQAILTVKNRFMLANVLKQIKKRCRLGLSRVL